MEPTTGPNRVDVQTGTEHRAAIDVGFGLFQRATANHQANVKGCAAYIRSDHVGIPQGCPQGRRANHAAGRAGLQGADWGLARSVAGHHPAGGLYDIEAAWILLFLETSLKRAEIAIHAGHHIGVEDAGGGAFVLAPLARDGV